MKIIFLLLILSISILFFGITCINSYKIESKQQDKVVVIVKVEDVTTLRDIKSTKRWQVQIKINEIIYDPHANLQVNDKTYLYVHSIIKTFFVDVENIKGKVFRVTYLQDYNTKYSGKLEVIKID